MTNYCHLVAEIDQKIDHFYMVLVAVIFSRTSFWRLLLVRI